MFFECEGDHYLKFNAAIAIIDIILALLNVVLAFRTKKHLPTEKKYRRYHESAVINLTTMMALFLSTICKVILILFRINNIQDGILLIVVLGECVWLYPVIFLLFTPKVGPFVTYMHIYMCTYT